MPKILLAESDRISLELGRAFLRTAGVELLTCLNGEEVLDIVRQELPALVLMSMNMPGGNSLENVKQIKSDQALKNIPIVLICKSAREEELSQFRRAGINDLLLKPISRPSFLAAVNKFIDTGKMISPRFKSCIPVSFGFNTPQPFACHSHDLSEGGIFLETGNAFPLDTRLVIRFRIPGADTDIQCGTRVAWINRSGSLLKPALPSGIGLQFLDMTPAGISAIREYLLRQA
jgi:CheY-like chemotaxis protein/Tfp pilus assembly protein PilZ